MTKREAKRIACHHAAAWISNLLGAGWPYEMREGDDPPESEADLERLELAMEEIAQELYRRGGEGTDD